ncbi:MAG TPA: AraC family transcriptional regulator [Microvirga sp.]|nr:AraC family transcriptional regulator [Microvirga sp.]
MQLSSITPHAEIAPFIHHFWVFRSPTGLPLGDARVVVPNGRHKLIVPWRNGLAAAGAGRISEHKEGEILLVGLWEQPTTIASGPAETCTIGVEFLPHGLHRFLPGDLDEITQAIVPIDAYLGAIGSELTRRVGSAESVEEAVDLVHAFLLARFRAASARDSDVVDHALRLMAESRFTLEVKELERRMGYSRRHLQTIFKRKVGLTPKRLETVLAFERLYRRFSLHRSPERLRDDALEVFYDQSHFIRTFRRFTGLPPSRFAELENEFGQIFYRNARPDSLSRGPARLRASGPLVSGDKGVDLNRLRWREQLHASQAP